MGNHHILYNVCDIDNGISALERLQVKAKDIKYLNQLFLNKSCHHDQEFALNALQNVMTKILMETDEKHPLWDYVLDLLDVANEDPQRELFRRLLNECRQSDIFTAISLIRRLRQIGTELIDDITHYKQELYGEDFLD